MLCDAAATLCDNAAISPPSGLKIKLPNSVGKLAADFVINTTLQIYDVEERSCKGKTMKYNCIFCLW